MRCGVTPIKTQYGTYDTIYPQQNHNLIRELGINTVWQHVRYGLVKDTLDASGYKNIVASNPHFLFEKINYYASGYYSRWEAEENIPLTAHYPGVKHEIGKEVDNYWTSEDAPIVEGDPPLLITGLLSR